MDERLTEHEQQAVAAMRDRVMARLVARIERELSEPFRSRCRTLPIHLELGRSVLDSWRSVDA